MPTAECSQDLFDFGTVDGRRIVGAFDGGLITSDAGALLLGATNKAIRLVERFASCFSDGRDAEQNISPRCVSSCGPTAALPARS